jgi:tyrosinase
MHGLSLVKLLALALPVAEVLAHPPPPPAPSSNCPPKSCCARPLIRKEWRALSKQERLDYLSAVKCLMAAPPQLAHLYPGSKSRFDDFQAAHIELTPLIHWNAPFLPWHRMFVHLYEQDLRKTCGYKGAQPYWDWSLDAVSEEAVLASPLFDPVYGFGGNGPYIPDEEAAAFPNLPFVVPGRSGGGCITDGPFADRNVSLGLGDSVEYQPHCLRRDISPWLLTHAANADVVSHVLDAPDFWEFNKRAQGGLMPDEITLHGSGHIAIGGNAGEIANVNSSPGDPIFYLHHANLDRVWEQWQAKNSANRNDFFGPDKEWSYPFDFFGPTVYQNITAEFGLVYSQLAGANKVQDLLHPQKGPLCYVYA